MNLKKISVAIAAAMIGTTIAATAQADDVGKIKERGELVVGVKADYRPFGFLNQSGKIVGFGPDLAADIAKQMGVKLKLVPVVASNRIQYLQQGRIDLIVATLSDTPARHKIIDLVEPNYYGAGLNVLALKSAGFKSWEQLRGKKVCLIQGSYYNKELQEKFGVVGMAFPGTAEAYEALKNGQCVGVAYDDTALTGELLKPQWSKYDMPLKTIFFVGWSIGARLGDKHFSSVLSKMVVDWHKSGKIINLEKKWHIKPTAFAKDQHLKYK